MKMREIIAGRMLATWGCEKHSRDSRQQRRAATRKQIFSEINEKFGLEVRKVRRGIALTLARRKKATK